MQDQQPGRNADQVESAAEIRRRKILENSSKRLAKITNLAGSSSSTEPSASVVQSLSHEIVEPTFPSTHLMSDPIAAINDPLLDSYLYATQNLETPTTPIVKSKTLFRLRTVLIILVAFASFYNQDPSSILHSKSAPDPFFIADYSLSIWSILLLIQILFGSIDLLTLDTTIHPMVVIAMDFFKGSFIGALLNEGGRIWWFVSLLINMFDDFALFVGVVGSIAIISELANKF